MHISRMDVDTNPVDSVMAPAEATRVIDPDHAPNTLNKPNPYNNRSAGDTCFTIGIFNAVVRHGMHLQEWHSGSNSRSKRSRTTLTPCPEGFQALIRRINGALLEDRQWSISSNILDLFSLKLSLAG